MTELILKYCRVKDNPKNFVHSDWCELVTGLWDSCDCHVDEHYRLLSHLEFMIHWLKGAYDR